MANNLNDILIAQFKKAFTLTDFQTSFVQQAFYMGYFLLAVPAALVTRAKGYKTAIVTGLVLYAAARFALLSRRPLRRVSVFPPPRCS